MTIEQRVGMWMMLDMLPVEYGVFYQYFHFMMWLFQFLTEISFGRDYMMWQLLSLMEELRSMGHLQIHLIGPVEAMVIYGDH